MSTVSHVRTAPSRSVRRLLVVLSVLAATVVAGLVGLAPTTGVARAAVGAPSWWSGDCDSTHWNAAAAAGGWTGVGAHRLGASYLGVPVCGAASGSPDVWWSKPGWGELEWECPELAFRFMAQIYGVSAYSANGVDVVANYTTASGGNLIKIANPTAGIAPEPGDVVSFRSASNPAGHVAVVASSTVDSSGNGSVRLLTENDTVDGWRTLTVTGWRLGSFGDYVPYGWLHDPAGRGGTSVPVLPANGTFVTYHGAAYRMAGGAAVYISAWSTFGGQQPTTPLSDAQWAALPINPADGTFVTGAQTGEVYRIAGGAPLYVSTWSVFGGRQPTVIVDQTALDRAGSPGYWSHLNQHPRDGTYLRAGLSGAVYRVAAGRPFAISSCSPLGGCPTPVSIDPAAVVNAGAVGLWNHLLAWPPTGTVAEQLPSGRYSSFSPHGCVAATAPAGQAVVQLNDSSFSCSGLLVPVTPTRLLDTRIGLGATLGPVPANGSVSLLVNGQGGVPATGVAAVLLNVTVTAPSGGGGVTAYADGTTRPIASNLNYVAGQTVPNLVLAPVGVDGRVVLAVTGSSTQLVADVSGYVTGGAPIARGAIGALAPTRLLDTRSGVGAARGPVVGGTTVSLEVTGRGGVPATGVAAVVLNVTVTQPSGAGYVTVYADGSPVPTASNLNYVRAQTVPNLVVAPVGADGRVALRVTGSATHLVADVSAYVLASGNAQPGTLTSLAPARLLDTRIGLGAATGSVPGGSTVSLPVVGRGGVPTTGVTAVLLNVTVTGPTAAGVVTVYADGSPLPMASNLNYVAGQTVPNLVLAPVGPDGKVDLSVVGGTVQLIADVSAYLN